MISTLSAQSRQMIIAALSWSLNVKTSCRAGSQTYFTTRDFRLVKMLPWLFDFGVNVVEE